jgi:hypothetical protein
MQHKGMLSTEKYNLALADIIALIEAKGEARQHLSDFMVAWALDFLT